VIPQGLIESSIALLLWVTDENGGDDVALFNGTFKHGQSIYYVDRGPGKEKFEIKDEWLERIQEVPEDLVETLRGASYQLSLTVGMLDDSEDFSQYLHRAAVA